MIYPFVMDIKEKHDLDTLKQWKAAEEYYKTKIQME